MLLETSAVQRGVSLPPVVLIGEVDQPVADHVWIDNVAATRAMTSCLIKQGHRRIASLGAMHVRDLPAPGAGLPRRRSSPPAAGRPEPGDRRRWDPEGGYGPSGAGWPSTAPPDALFCFTDSLALGALHAFADAGLRVPDDVSVVGYDDVPEAAHYARR